MQDWSNANKFSSLMKDQGSDNDDENDDDDDDDDVEVGEREEMKEETDK